MEDHDESLILHLDALRSMLISCLVALGIGLIPTFLVAPFIMEELIKIILSDNKVSLNYFSPLEVFILQIKIALTLDLLLCFPYIGRQIWQFLLPALYESERRFIKSLILFSSLLFLTGIFFCIFFILPLIVNFGLSFSTPDMKALFGISNIIGLTLMLSVIFGLMFQFPLITYALIRFGVVSYHSVQNKRPYIFVTILIMAGILTPPDIISQLMLTIPTYFLFEIGLFAARPYKSVGE